tara:strand:+ start:182 stop:430 length:249 start_codon:yes stop_codon:yes gene_type:complete
MLPLLLISGSIISSGFIGGILGYKYCLCERKKNNNKTVHFNISDDSENNNSTILKSPILSSPDIINTFEIQKKYDNIIDKKL